jgi:hypothetical protein
LNALFYLINVDSEEFKQMKEHCSLKGNRDVFLTVDAKTIEGLAISLTSLDEKAESNLEVTVNS